MTCGYNNRRCMSVQTAYNDVEQPFVATGTPVVILGSKATDTGSAIDTGLNVFRIRSSGIYRISYDVDLTAAGAGDVVLQLYDGQDPLPCAIATRTTATDLDYAMHVETVLYLPTCCAVHHVIGARISGVAGTVTHVCASIVKLD